MAVALTVAPAAGLAAYFAFSPGEDFWFAAAAYVGGYLLTIPNPSGRRVALTAAIAGAAALVTGGSATVVVGAAAVALPVGFAAIVLRFGRRVADDVFPSDPAGLIVFAAVYSGGILLMRSTAPNNPEVLSLFTVAALGWIGTSVMVRTVFSRQGGRVPRRLTMLRAAADWPAYAALFSSAALYSVTVGRMGWWAVPLAGLPYLFSHVSLHRLQTTRLTYEQTIRALGEVPEASGQVPAGHSARTADLAVAVGAEVGLSAGALRRLEYAALLHDIGRVVLANPAVAQGDYSFGDVAGWSAAIIAEARYLEPVADIVASQHQSYRKPGEVRDPDVPTESQIVRIVARYDSGVAGGESLVAALEGLHQGAAYDYDPGLVMALRRVLERRGAIAA